VRDRGGERAEMNKKVYNGIIFFFLAVFVVSATILVTKAAPAVVLTPTSGEPGDTIDVDGTGFAVSTSVGIGLGAEVAVTGESGTATDTGQGTNPRIISGYTARPPVKPGSFRWILNQGGVLIEYFDYGNSTLGTLTGFDYPASINYTTGFFIRTMTNNPPWDLLGSTVNYTTYDVGVASSGLRTDGSGVLSGNFTVPDNIWNGTHAVTVIDEAGNKATSDFTVVGSDFIPEALTVSAIVLLTSTAIVVSFYWLRKPSHTERVA
jgi:hypothetical protein